MKFLKPMKSLKKNQSRRGNDVVVVVCGESVRERERKGDGEVLAVAALPKISLAPTRVLAFGFTSAGTSVAFTTYAGELLFPVNKHIRAEVHSCLCYSIEKT